MNNEIQTHENTPRSELTGRAVLVRPFYFIPVGKNMVTNIRSPWSMRAFVETVPDDPQLMVIVRHAIEGPWRVDAAYFPKELHTRDCRCPACQYEGEGLGDEVRNGA